MRTWIGLCALTVLLSVQTGCSRECKDVCSDAQDENCTIVDCDCNQFCDNLRSLADKSGCTSQADAYEDCATDEDTCSVSSKCSGEENAFGACVLVFCQANPGDSDCTFLLTTC